MLTHDTNSLTPGQGRQAFLLGKTGRIIADMIILHEAQRTLLDLDLFQAATLPAELEKYIFTEDVQLIDRSAAFAYLALHGPAGATLLEALGAAGGAGLQPLQHQEVTIVGRPCVLYRRDETGSPGLHLIVPHDGALEVYEALAKAVGGLTPLVEGGVVRPIRGRGIGWAAYNTARIEAGTPLFHIDFGPDSLPHETGILNETVSFTKGCYLGQEIVARMQNLGHPKRVLVGLKFVDDSMPIAGAQVMEAPEGISDPQGHPIANTGKIIGAITSSTVSPLLGGVAIAFATVKWGMHQPGTMVAVPAEGRMAPGKVQILSFL